MNGYYVTGFSDGEGCFVAYPSFRKTKKGFTRIVFHIRWSIQIREDDLSVLEQIKTHIDLYEMGVGSISRRKRKNDSSANVTLAYDGIKNCHAILHHFQTYPSLAKKRNDFERWEKIFKVIEENQYQKDKSGFREYNEEEILIRLQICKMCDELRISRVDKEMKDLGIQKLLQRAGGSSEMYVEKFLNELLSGSVITQEQYYDYLSKYRVKI
jgi:hypothetical protein